MKGEKVIIFWLQSSLRVPSTKLMQVTQTRVPWVVQNDSVNHLRCIDMDNILIGDMGNN